MAHEVGYLPEGEDSYVEDSYVEDSYVEDLPVENAVPSPAQRDPSSAMDTHCTAIPLSAVLWIKGSDIAHH
ncbi:hypothetical protein KUCAC02_019903 [Chaenocephalus aceratus]|uniref:Uncharacterized protein n=1 Tax=Chaenocephalus aceratus TaxID=36190 RepID=A0ACB9VQU1_CHAAC|nr:hypothetical protein KUCAC02_019903 [Chaenocephalus aceratus]